MAKMTQCKNCSKEIASNVKLCPSCGTKNKKPFYKRGWFIALAIFIILGSIGGGDSDDTTTITDSVTTETEQVSDENKETEEAIKEVESEKTELVSYELVKSKAIAILEEKFGENGEIMVHEEEGSDSVLFSVPSPDGIVEGIFAINSGIANDELIESYEYMKESFIGLSESLFELGQTCGKSFAIGLQNNQNTENLLLTVLNGVVISEVAEY